MAPRAALVAGLLVAAEAQANGNPNGFLGEYSKFITPSVNHMKHGNGATMGFAATREQSLINTKDRRGRSMQDQAI